MPSLSQGEAFGQESWRSGWDALDASQKIVDMQGRDGGCIMTGDGLGLRADCPIVNVNQ
jgi:hypothetical protein